MGNTKSVCSRCWRACCGCSGNDAVSPVHTSTIQDMSSATAVAAPVAERYPSPVQSSTSTPASASESVVAVAAPVAESVPSPVQASTYTPASASESVVAVAVQTSTSTTFDGSSSTAQDMSSAAAPPPAAEEDPSPVQASTSTPASAPESVVAVADQTSTSTALDGSLSTTAQPPSIAADGPSALQSSTSASVSTSAVPDHALQSILDISNDGVDGELTTFIADIRILLSYAKGSPSSSLHDPKPNRRKWKFIDTSPLASLKDFFSASADAASGLMSSDQSEALKSIVKTALNGIGKAHWIAAGLVAVAFVLDRFDLISSNKSECIGLLDEMCRLAEYLQILKQRKRLKQQIEATMEEALRLVVEGCTLCFSQATSSRWCRFFKGPVDKRHLEDLRQDLEKMYKHLMFQVIIRTYDASEPILLPRMEFYPKEAVVPDGKVEEIVEQLELESDKNVVAVILHGFGGIGKTTVADAVYAKVDDILGFKFSKVALYENIGSVPNTLAVQNKILDDISEIQVGCSTSTDGQKLLERCFQKDPCFVYIDNVLSGRELAKVLPTRLDASKKLRLLLTARDAGVRSGLGGMNSRNDVKLLSVDSLPEAEALTLLKQEMGRDVADKLSEEQRNYLLEEVCSGVPLLIQMVSRYVKYHGDINVAVDVIRQQRECDFGEQFGEENVEFFSFALDGLQQRYTEAFFDICAFFNGQTEWAVLQNIFGENTMEVLERRALIKQTFFELAEEVVLQVETEKVGKVHDVLLQMGRSRCKSNRITTVAQLKSMIQSDDFQGTWQGVKGISIEETELEEVLTLPCSKLDFISSSLRILCLDFQDQDGNLFQGIGVEGECKAGFSSLIYFHSRFSQPPFDVTRCLQLTYLSYAPNCTVYLHQMPSRLRILELELKEENAVIGNVENEHGVVSSLRDFSLGGSYLRDIPHGLLSNMKSLLRFSLYNVRNVWYMPDELHTLPCLTRIAIMSVGFRSVRGLSESIGACAFLKTLILSRCQQLVQLPPAIANLSSLEALVLSRCSNLLDFPDNFEGLVSLRFLHLSTCKNLKHLGSTFSKLPSLQILNLNFCTQLEEKWVDIFVQMKSLKVISLKGCPPLIKRWEKCYKDSANIICLY